MVPTVDGVMQTRISSAAMLLCLAACATTPPAVRVAAAVARPAPAAPAPIRSGVIGLRAVQLQAMFGTPIAQLTEGPARKMQFAGTTCVLDAYLYPNAQGEPAVTHVDTRKLTGEDADRAACVASLRTR